MLRAEVGRQGRLDVVPGILFSAIIWEPRAPAQALHWSNHLTALLSQLPLQLRILEDILGCRAYWSQHLLAATLMLLFQICYSQPEHRHLPLAQGKVGEEPGPKRTGLYKP